MNYLSNIAFVDVGQRQAQHTNDLAERVGKNRKSFVSINKTMSSYEAHFDEIHIGCIAPLQHINISFGERQIKPHL